jgi:RHS repeat-associated protein
VKTQENAVRSYNRRWALLVAVAVATPVVVVSIGMVDAIARWRPAAVQQPASVAGHSATAKPVPRPAIPAWKPAAASWPAAGTIVAGQARVQTFDQAAAARAGVTGLLLKVLPTTGEQVPVSLDYAKFRYAYGGDWASRLGLVRLPDCAATTPQEPGCDTATPVVSHNDVHAARVSADVPASGGVYALAAAPGGGTGDYKATSLSPSATWQVSEQTGDFDWSYPLRTPDGPDGDNPSLALTYSSQSVDGRTASTNNQASWVGEGWDLRSGYVERRYKACSDDGASAKSGDQCWAGDNATLSLNGKASELIRDDASGTWRLKDDDGSRVEKLPGASNGTNGGEHWRVTTTDGTQYYFGLNHLPGWASGNPVTNSTWTIPVYGNDSGEPCHGSSFATSWCQQAWRWNLDYVVDPHGSAASYVYTAETNFYRRGYDGTNSGTMTSYIRGGYLKEVDYGQRSTTMYSAGPLDKVTFGVSERCVADASFDCASNKFTKANASHWPDVPFDESCASGDACTVNVSPSFWSRMRLTSVTTSVRIGSSFQNVDTWNLTQSFPPPGDGTTPSLWLDQITHLGDVGGSVALPAVTFGKTQLQNRVDTVGDSLAPLDKYRIGTIDSETGGRLSITYSAPDCTASTKPDPATNTKRCFPQYWSGDPPQAKPFQDWFHKYVVTQVAQVDLTGGASDELTSYSYLDTPAWHFDDDEGLTKDKEKTWGDWRGYSKVRVVTGVAGQPQSQTDYTYFRGMDGDRADATDVTKLKSVGITDSQGTPLPDTAPLNGQQREKIEYNGTDGAVLEDDIDDPWTLQTAKRVRPWGTSTANLSDTGTERTRTPLAAGGWRVTETDHSFDSNGLETQVNDLADVSISTDDHCNRTTYAQNTAAWMLDYPARVENVAVACTDMASRPNDVVSDVRTSYDGQAYGVAPTKGDDTRVEKIASYSGSTPVYVTDKVSGYDLYGRTTSVTDALNRTTTTTYTPASGGLATNTLVKDPKGYATSTDLNPAWGQATGVTDENNKRTDLGYDALGRLTQVWLPGRAKASHATTPNLVFGYQIRGSAGPTAVSTGTLHTSGSYDTSYQLYDGFLRERQTQAPSPGGGRIVTDKFYDSRGLVARSNDMYFNGDSGPSATLFVPTAAVPGQTVTTFDGAQRPTVETFYQNGNPRWHTTTSYEGSDRVSVNPPAGGTPSTVVTDARGRTVQLLEYHGTQATGAADVTSYTYANDGQVATVTDAAGNIRTYRYDLRGRKIETDDPDAGVSRASYDDADQLVSSTDGNGNTLAFTYDALGRRTAEYLGGTSGAKLSQWDYDTIAKGELTDSIRFAGGRQYTTTVTGYDDRYQPLGTTLTIPAGEGQLTGSYTTYTAYNTDTDGTPSSVNYPAVGSVLAGETVTIGYGDLGQPATLTGQASYVAGTTYSKIGQLLQQSRSDGNGHQVVRTNTFEDGTSRLTRVQDERSASPTTVNDTHYGYNDAGEVTSISNSPAADNQCFGYDYLQRLTSAWTTNANCSVAPSTSVIGGPAPYWQSYTYDTTGNRTSETDHATTSAGTDAVHTYAYPAPGSAQPHTLLSVSTSGGANNGRVDRNSYDPAGNTTSRTKASDNQVLTWDAEGNVATATKDGQTSTFVYDADGTLLLRRDPTGATLYADGQEVTDSSTSAVSATRYYTFAGATVAARSSVSGLFWMLDDRQGTGTTTVSGDATQAVNRRYYTPFGQARGVAPSDWPGDKGFVGGIVETATDFTVLGARDYDAETGRFLSHDPVTDISEPQQMNGYTYANDDPVTLSDPTGERPGRCDAKCYRNRTHWWNHIHRHQRHFHRISAPFQSRRARAEYRRAIANYKRITEAIYRAYVKQQREQAARKAEVQRQRNQHKKSFWDHVVGFVNTIAPAVTILAIALAFVPGLDIIAAGLALTVDTIAALTNGADAIDQLSKGHYSRAGGAALNAGLSAVGAGLGGKAMRISRVAKQAKAVAKSTRAAWEAGKTVAGGGISRDAAQLTIRSHTLRVDSKFAEWDAFHSSLTLLATGAAIGGIQSLMHN